jgi:TRAP-type C4-dicarboxylate transport system permease small subunit
MNAALEQATAMPPRAANATKTMSMKDRVETALATVFGMVFLGLAVLVTIETTSRKLFNVSLQGADELGGYALAVGSTIAFSLALMGRNHIRVDVFHELLPRAAQAVLNWLAVVSLAVFAIFIDWVALKVVADTLEYRSTAQTPWATPLIYPRHHVALHRAHRRPAA